MEAPIILGLWPICDYKKTYILVANLLVTKATTTKHMEKRKGKAGWSAINWRPISSRLTTIKRLVANGLGLTWHWLAIDQSSIANQSQIINWTLTNHQPIAEWSQVVVRSLINQWLVGNRSLTSFQPMRTVGNLWQASWLQGDFWWTPTNTLQAKWLPEVRNTLRSTRVVAKWS